MKNRRITFLLLAAILILACSCPLVGATGGNTLATATSTLASASEPAVAFTATNTVGSTNPFASPSGQPVNCRTGPGTNWPVLVILNPGQSAAIVGKSPDGTWWKVNIAGNLCWVSAGFTTTTGDLSGIPVAAIPPTVVVPTEAPVASSGVVTSVSMSLSKNTIHVGGCMGPIQPLTIYATIEVNGPLKTNWHFDTQQNGSLPSHGIKFTQGGSKDISDSFTPPLTPGHYRVALVMDDVNLKGMNAVVFYDITC